MHLSADISSALQQIEAVKKGIDESDDPKLQMQTAESLNTILGILQDPVFRTIVHVQDSLSELNAQLGQHPSMLPNDFDIDVAGNLVLSLNGGEVMYDFDDQQSISATRSPTSHSAPGSPDKSAGEEQRPQSQNSKTAAGADLYATDYAQIQAIELVNDGTGLGFGIIGARSSGVIVKTILPGGVADRDGRLRSGDHILQIGDVNLHEMVSEQVAAVLRQSGTHVRLVVARPIEQNVPTPQYALEPGCAVVPTRVLVDPAELERYLISTGYPEIFGESSTASTPQTTTEDDRFVYRGETSMLIDPTIDLEELLALPETEKLQVELKKDANGLGITIAGYVCEKEELSGIFVKSVSPGSAADLSGRIRVNDRIIEVDGQSLQGYSNHQAVELLKKSGQVVNLRLERYLRGPKYEQLQQAIAANDKLPSSAPGTPSRAQLPTPVATTSSATTTPSRSLTRELEDEALPAPEAFMTTPPSNTTMTTTTLSTFGAGKQLVAVRDSLDGSTKIIPTDVVPLTEKIEQAPVHAKNGAVITRHKYYTDPELTDEAETEIIRKWQKIVGSDVEVIVAQIKKFAVGGLGISLEGTVDVEGGREVRPHHYIRSILPDGPVGVNAVLRSGDELLEVNGERLLGMNHLEVVAILKELPLDVRMVCGRNKNTSLLPFSDDTLKKLSNNFENLLPATDRLVKAKSDGSLATAGSVADADSVAAAANSFTKLKSRSLEPLTGLAMWSSQPQIIELVKGDRGLGFSILDYQDPLDPNDTLIVIRSLVPGGVAQLDGRLIPGDRLLFVNSINLENASLDQAVQALKGASKGVVRIGVAKPLPMTDNSLKACSTASTTSEETLEAQMSPPPPALPTVAPPAMPTAAKGVEPDLIPDWRN
ncbi:patj homolog isoform X1 [Drosophila miranda]|uniref:patj homolog isoform X1 n=1 Tax=Drosophila persimilis TaxID=7234 RepID=UPI0007E706A6|nr:patj homolog isoform X1 [Drosophila persimilis]XP_033242059.1 patj homolog isoform X1 [Drosophila miranda]